MIPWTSTTIRVSGPIASEVAWERYADLDRWPQWAPQISGVEAEHRGLDAGHRRLAPGLDGTVRAAAGLVAVRFRVLAVDEDARTWSWRVRVGPVRLRLDHGVDDRPDGRPGTRTWLRTRGPAPFVWAYTPLAFLALQCLVMP